MIRIPKSHWWLVASLMLATGWLQAASITNGGFESGLTGWKSLWTRDAETGKLSFDQQTRHSGRAAARIEHRGEQDWSLEPDVRLAVQPGEMLDLEAWIRVQGAGSATLCFSTWDRNNKALEWSFGERTTTGHGDWSRLQTRIIVPAKVAQVQPRLIGHGSATVWVDDVALQAKGNLASARRQGLAGALSITNPTLTVTIQTADGSFSVTDRRTGQRWSQKPTPQEVLLLDARADSRQADLKLLHAASGLELSAKLQLAPEGPELSIELDAQGELPSALRFPYAFASALGEYLVVPMNEGISYPVDDASIEPMRLIAYGGHGICMAFWGVTDGSRGHIAIIESPDDAAIRIQRVERLLTVAPEWESQKRQFGYARRLRYVFFDQGGHVAIAKRYREHAKQIGLFKTLAEKRRPNGNVDKLIGAVNVWCWDKNPVPIVEDMKAAGIERILWSNRQTPEGMRAMNKLGVLTSRYDIYQDLMNPEHFKNLRGVHSDWTTEGWPKDIMIGPSGDWIKGWRVRGKDGEWYPCGVLCDLRAPEYAKKRIPPELATHAYRSRFIDTTTASSWRECYSPDHPLTRSESRRSKMELLRYVSQDLELVTGSETGHDAAVPFVHYFEGMLSLGPYRVPDAGRDMQRIWTEVPERVAKFQLGHRYRLPLWELVFHDCVVAQWYWGDYNNKLPALWDKRDLFNLLYGTPPMFMFNRDLWEKNKERFVTSYRNTCPVVRAVGYSEMVAHRFLTPNRDVQQTTFDNGVTITVNFGERPYDLRGGVTVAPTGFHVAGVAKN